MNTTCRKVFSHLFYHNIYHTSCKHSITTIIAYQNTWPYLKNLNDLNHFVWYLYISQRYSWVDFCLCIYWWRRRHSYLFVRYSTISLQNVCFSLNIELLYWYRCGNTKWKACFINIAPTQSFLKVWIDFKKEVTKKLFDRIN